MCWAVNMLQLMTIGAGAHAGRSAMTIRPTRSKAPYLPTRVRRRPGTLRQAGRDDVEIVHEKRCTSQWQ